MNCKFTSSKIHTNALTLCTPNRSLAVKSTCGASDAAVVERSKGFLSSRKSAPACRTRNGRPRLDQGIQGANHASSQF